MSGFPPRLPLMHSFAILILYCALIVAASLIGGRLPTLVTLTHNRMQLLISFVGGLMLGISLFHMLPHAVQHLGAAAIDQIVLCLMLGLLVMFFLLRTFHFHHHDPDQLEGHAAGGCDRDHGHMHSRQHAVPASSSESTNSASRKLAADMSWLGVFVGLSLHTLIDGLILGASIEGERLHDHGTLLPGLGVFLAILLHKPLDALSITALMRASGWSARWQLIVNAGFALMCPLGAAAFLLGARMLAEQQDVIVGSMLAFAAGVFLCISLSDLLPEMEFHSHHRIRLSVALLLGIGLAWALRWVEPAEIHGSPRAEITGDESEGSLGGRLARDVDWSAATRR